MKILNCAPMLALLAGSVGMGAPADANILKLNTASVSASHDVLSSASLKGDERGLQSASNQQQIKQQQRKNLAAQSGVVYDAPPTGFSV